MPSAAVCSLRVEPEAPGVNAIASPMVVEDGGPYVGEYVLLVNQYETDDFSGEVSGPIATTLALNADSISGAGSCLSAYDLPDSTRRYVGAFTIRDSLEAGGFRLYSLSKWNGANLSISGGDTVYCQAPTTLTGSVTVSGVLRFVGLGTVTCNADITVMLLGVVEVGEGVTIALANNTYPYKKIYVNSGGRLSGEDSTSSIVRGQIKLQGYSPALTTTVSGVKVWQFDYYGYGYGGIEVSTVCHVTISGCWIDGDGDGARGIYAIGSHPYIKLCRFTDLDVGVYAYNGADCRLYRTNRPYTECSDCDTANNVFEEDCYVGIMGYLNSEYVAGCEYDSYGGCNDFLRDTGHSGTNYHAWFKDTGEQYVGLNRWEGTPYIYLNNASLWDEYTTCSSFSRTARRTESAVRPLHTAIETASAPAQRGDVATALANLRALAAEQDTALNALFVLDRITELVDPDAAVAEVEAVRAADVNDAVMQAAAWAMGRLEALRGNDARSQEWYEAVGTGRAGTFLATEALFVRAERLFESVET